MTALHPTYNECVKRPRKQPVLELWRSFVQELPHLGTAGSRAAHLHDTASGITTATTTDVDKSKQVKRHQLTHDEMRRFIVLRLMGTFGALMLAFGALGAGALPVTRSRFFLAAV